MNNKSTVVVALLSLTLSFGSFYHFFENAVSRLWNPNGSIIDAGPGLDGNGRP
jgi:hypothetical protein